jgi:hypothetical protein
MPEHQVWQTPDRDSSSLTLDQPLMSEQLFALLHAEGHDGNNSDAVFDATGIRIPRPRRYQVMYERMGILFHRDGITRLTPLGRLLRSLPGAQREQRRAVARAALQVLSRYQLRNPADANRPEAGAYPADCDIHPYWAVLKAADELGGTIHWDEVNRELMRVLRHADLPAAIERIRRARQEQGYDPVQGGTPAAPLQARAHEAGAAGGDRDPIGQLRDQQLTPFLKRAGMAELVLETPGREGNGYWRIPDDVRDLVHQAVQTVPEYREFTNEQEWFEHLGEIEHFYPTEVSNGATIGENAPEAPAVPFTGATNTIVFGPPGTGKSHSVAEETRGALIHRTVFHPEYSYAEFVGSYKPVSGSLADKKILSADGATERGHPVIYYDFEPGVFTSALVDALKKPAVHVALIIEEINRGDCAAIFGDLFQLLDRDDAGQSKYPIRPITALGRHLRDREVLDPTDETISIPPNLSLLATMNTSDQALFPMDAAFKRRWSWRSVTVGSGRDQLAGVEIAGGGEPTSWLDLVDRINDKVVELGLSEDKRIGVWYLKARNGSIAAVDVREKLLFYLWHDVFKTHRRTIFANSVRSFEQLQDLMDSGGVRAALAPLFPAPAP